MKTRCLVAACLTVSALAGCHAGLGPSVGYALDRGVTLGWEGGGGYEWAHGNLGQSFRREEGGWDVLTYGAFEPILYLAGPTLGAAVGTRSGGHALVGLWAGLPVPFPETCYQKEGGEPGFAVTFALGYRWMGRDEIYFTPKLAWFQCPGDFFGGM